MYIDMTPGSSLANRTTSGFPVSIGTSVPLEALFPPRQASALDSQYAPDTIEVTQYNSIYINLDTLYRNLIASVSSAVSQQALDTTLLDYLLEDIEVINSVLQVEGSNTLKPYYYTMSYENVAKLLPKEAELRVPTTDKQRMEEMKRQAVMKALHEQTDEFYQFDSHIQFNEEVDKALLISHSPFDLFNYKAIRQLDLIETHTGKLKPFRQWNTKYHPVGKLDRDRLPFNRRLFWILGDRTLIKPMSIRHRRSLMELAESRSWNPLTSDEKIVTDVLQSDLDKVLKDIVMAVPYNKIV